MLADEAAAIVRDDLLSPGIGDVPSRVRAPLPQILIPEPPLSPQSGRRVVDPRCSETVIRRGEVRQKELVAEALFKFFDQSATIARRYA